MRWATKRLLKQIPKDASHIVLMTGWVPDLLDELTITDARTSRGVEFYANLKDGSYKKGYVRAIGTLTDYIPFFEYFGRANDIAVETYNHLSSQGIKCQVKKNSLQTKIEPFFN